MRRTRTTAAPRSRVIESRIPSPESRSSWRASEPREICDEIVDFTGRKPVGKARHQAGSRFFPDDGGIGLSHGVKFSGRVAKLDRENVLVESNPTHLCTIF